MNRLSRILLGYILATMIAMQALALDALAPVAVSALKWPIAAAFVATIAWMYLPLLRWLGASLWDMYTGREVRQ